MTFFTTPELLEIGDTSIFQSESEAYAAGGIGVLPQGGGALRARRTAVRASQKIEGSDNDFVVHTADHSRAQAGIPSTKADRGDGILRPPKLHEGSGRGSTQGPALLSRAASVFWAGCIGGWGKELGGHRGAGTVAARGRASRWCTGARRISNSVKYWIKPDIENRIKAGQVKAYFNSTVKEIASAITSC